jgi:Na+-transporting NADH:ubiquinone oxidoreductase subunit NqrB
MRRANQPQLWAVDAESRETATVAQTRFHRISQQLANASHARQIILVQSDLVVTVHCHLDAFKYWLKIFAVVFTIGVVSGLMMAFEIGANWSGYSK